MANGEWRGARGGGRKNIRCPSPPFAIRHSPFALDPPGRHPRRLCARAVRCELCRGWVDCDHSAQSPQRAGGGDEAGGDGVAGAGDPLHRALYRRGPQPGGHRDHAGMHPGLPLLPGRDDLPPGARAAGGGDPARRGRDDRPLRLRGGQLPQPEQQRLYPCGRVGAADDGEARGQEVDPSVCPPCASRASAWI